MPQEPEVIVLKETSEDSLYDFNELINTLKSAIIKMIEEVNNTLKS